MPSWPCRAGHYTLWRTIFCIDRETDYSAQAGDGNQELKRDAVDRQVLSVFLLAGRFWRDTFF